jgi:hypothetical protein
VTIAAPTLPSSAIIAAVDALDQPPDERLAQGAELLAEIGPLLFGHGGH